MERINSAKRQDVNGLKLSSIIDSFVFKRKIFCMKREERSADASKGTLSLCEESQEDGTN